MIPWSRRFMFQDSKSVLSKLTFASYFDDSMNLSTYIENGDIPITCNEFLLRTTKNTNTPLL